MTGNDEGLGRRGGGEVPCKQRSFFVHARRDNRDGRQLHVILFFFFAATHDNGECVHHQAILCSSIHVVDSRRACVCLCVCVCVCM